VIRDNIEHSHWEIRWAVLRHLTRQPAGVQAPFLSTATTIAKNDHNKTVQLEALVVLMKHEELAD